MKYRGRGKSAPILRLTDIISRGYLQQVRFFVDLGISIDVPDDNKRSPLMLCALMEPAKWGTGISRLLIEKGAIIDTKDKYGMNALHMACIYDRVELVNVLLQAIDFDLVQTDKWGNTALHYAVRTGNSVLVRLIKDKLLHYKIPLDTVNKEGLTALDEGYRYSQSACVAVLQNTTTESDDESLSQQCVPQLHTSKDILSSRSVSDISYLRTTNRPKTAHYPRECSTLSSSGSTLLFPFPEPRKFIRQARRELQPNEKDISTILNIFTSS
jgi:ankyrin repeat protein